MWGVALVKMQILIRRSGREPRVCIFTKQPGDVYAGGPLTTYSVGSL